MIKIIVDVHGGDNPASELVEGAVNAVNENKELVVILSGIKEEIEAKLNTLTYDKERVVVLPCTQIVTNYDSPTGVLKEKTDSSLIKGMTLLSGDDDIKGLISCGNTGAVLASSMFIVGRIARCRPTLATMLPNGKGGLTVIADCGANVDCKEEHLIGFAKMGDAYARASGITNPKVALLSNGAEEKKGNELVKNTHALLKEVKGINFIGNVEGSNCLSGDADVIVTDGFAGNIVLKNTEGTAKMIIKDMVKYARTLENKDEANEVMKTVNYLMNKYDFNSRGGAVILGVNKIVLKAHGVANKNTIQSCINMVLNLAKNNLVENIAKSFEE